MRRQSKISGLQISLGVLGVIVLLIVSWPLWNKHVASDPTLVTSGSPKGTFQTHAHDSSAIRPNTRTVSPANSLGNSSLPPNVVLFLIDTLRADRLGVYGYDRRPTSPNIDTLARRSVVFEHANAPAPWTLPTLVSLATSTFPCEHRTLDNRQQLSPNLDPLAARFKKIGYTTLGSYANAFAGPEYGLARGFDLLRASPATDGEQVARLLDRAADRPFYLYVHNIEPHTPFEFAPPHTDGFRDISRITRSKIASRYKLYRQSTRVDFAESRPLGTTDNSSAQYRHLAALTALREDYSELYDAAVHAADARVGSVIDELKRRGLWENTLFMLLADHGEEFGEHGGWLHDQSVYQELVHVPLLIHLPDESYAGHRVGEVVSLVDVLPSIFDYLNRPELAEPARGRSLLPLIRGETIGNADQLIVSSMRWNTKKYYRPWKEIRGDINVVVRRGRWKGIWNLEPDNFELYDLTNDPRERHNQVAIQTDLSGEMRRFARDWFETCGASAVSSPDKTNAPDEATLENLRKLGYID